MRKIINILAVLSLIAFSQSCQGQSEDEIGLITLSHQNNFSKNDNPDTVKINPVKSLKIDFSMYDDLDLIQLLSKKDKVGYWCWLEPSTNQITLSSQNLVTSAEKSFQGFNPGYYMLSIGKSINKNQAKMEPKHVIIFEVNSPSSADR